MDVLNGLLLPILLSCTVCYSSDVRHIQLQPEQIHLSATGNAGEMTVTWSTVNDTKASLVRFGKNITLNLVAKGTSSIFVDGGPEKRSQFIHRVKLTGLSPAQMYYYHCGSEDGWSPLFFFKAFPNTTDWSPRFAMYGDLGNENAQSLSRLQEEVQKGMYDTVFHIGDFAYELEEDNGRVGDMFMRQIESVAAYVPYMTAVGNHEASYNFSHYKNRFTMPNFEETANLWYSWDIGPAHIIVFSTEVYYYFQYGLFLITHQLNWLKQDLKAANKNRAERPWVITMAHRPMYCTDTDGDDCSKRYNIIRDQFEELFYDSGVDIEFWAHEHTYERLLPVYKGKVFNGSASAPYTNPNAPVHVVAGSAGCRELPDKFTPVPAPWDGFRSRDYGYLTMTVTNKTHAHFQQISDDQGGKVIDDFWVIKHKHGPYGSD